MMSVRRSACAIYWTAPNGDAYTLTPSPDASGLLEVEMHDDVVAVHSRNCLLVNTSRDDEFTELAEFEFTTSLHRTVIHWSLAERREGTSVERSAYFSQ